MTDLPPGEWTPLLIGDQWPSGISLSTTASAAATRKNLSVQFAEYFDRLLAIKHQNIAPQQGITAEDLRSTFDQGVERASHLSYTNGVKSVAYTSVYDKLVELRASLANLAEEGNSSINEVNSSKRPLIEKIAEIVAIITRTRDTAFIQAAACVGHISDQIRQVLTAQGIDTPPQAFANQHGAGPMTRPQADPGYLQTQVANKLGQLNGLQSTDPAGDAISASPSSPATDSVTSAPHTTPPPSALADGGAAIPSDLADGGGSPAAQPANPASSGPVSMPTTAIADGAGTPANQAATSPAKAPSNISITTVADGASAPPQPTTTQMPVATTPPNIPISTVAEGGASSAAPAHVASGIGGPNVSTGPSRSAPTAAIPNATPSIDAPTAATSPTAGNPLGTAHTPTGLAPTDLAQSFNAGNHTGAPMSASAEAISSAATSPVHSTPPPFTSPMADAGAPAAPAFETAHAAAAAPAETSQIAQAPTVFTQPVVATPAAAPITPTVSAPPPVTAGGLSMPTATPPSGLLAYGSDLRPAATAIPTAPSMPPATAPGSAPVSPASGSNPTGQPAVVRQQPTSATAQAGAAAGLTERAFAATATGAAVGAGAARSAAKDRLQRLLEAVARQEPKLNWGIGDLEDGTTLLATDLAGGWIPPGIEIPAGVELLGPNARTGDLEAILGPTKLTMAYGPGQYLPPAKDAEPVSMSIRARDTDAVDDLGWELSQATKWRDGLPRLAHTLAKAASAKTGYLDSEVELLRDYLDSIARMVISKYPDNVVPAQVGNWQLLATINALINDEKTLANYHFAWFQAQALTREGKS